MKSLLLDFCEWDFDLLNDMNMYEIWYITVQIWYQNSQTYFGLFSELQVAKSSIIPRTHSRKKIIQMLFKEYWQIYCWEFFTSSKNGLQHVKTLFIRHQKASLLKGKALTVIILLVILSWTPCWQEMALPKLEWEESNLCDLVWSVS